MASRGLPIALLVVVALASAVFLSSALGKDEPKAAPAVEREAMAETTKVQGAPGRSLVLSRVTVAPGAELALHHHLGTQIAQIASGVLTYTVEQGAVKVRSGEADQDPQVVRTIANGETGRIKAGEWIVEQPSAIHRAANRGHKPVVIYLATLLKTGAPPSTPVAESQVP